MDTWAAAAFWFALAFVAYTYAGYPLLAWLLARLRSRTKDGALSVSERLPSVTIVVAAHNERERIARKVENLLALDYPADLLSIVIAADGCTDGTEDAFSAHRAVRVAGYADRRGKPSALNHALESVTSEVVAFTDARQELEPDALRRLVRHLADPRIGAVSGELKFRSGRSSTEESVGLYWRYEKFMRRNESRWHSTVGVTGAIYAIRRADWERLPTNLILDDVLVPMRIARRGRRILFEPGAVAWDMAEESLAGERRRKLRTLAGNYQLMFEHAWLLSPRGNPLWLQYWSHKVFRLAVPYALVAMLVSSAVVGGRFYTGALIGQLLAYAAGAVGLGFPRSRRIPVLNVAALFIDLNLAAVNALLVTLRGGPSVRWAKS